MWLISQTKFRWKFNKENIFPHILPIYFSSSTFPHRQSPSTRTILTSSHLTYDLCSSLESINNLMSFFKDHCNFDCFSSRSNLSLSLSAGSNIHRTPTSRPLLCPLMAPLGLASLTLFSFLCIIFYDILFLSPLRVYAPFPCKTSFNCFWRIPSFLLSLYGPTLNEDDSHWWCWIS